MAVLLEKRNLRGLIIDATVTESHSKSAVVTEENISAGASVADHMRASNSQIILRAIISDAPPLSYSASGSDSRPSRLGFESMPILDSFTGESNPNGNSAEERQIRTQLVEFTGLNHFGSISSTFDYSNSGSRTKAAWTRLNELMNDKEVCSLVTDIKVYEEVVVTNISTERSRQNIDKIDVSITLKEIKRVSAKEETITVIQSKGSKNKGTIETKCLPFSQVFTSNTTIGEGADVLIANKAIDGKVRSFSQAELDRICTSIATRYKNLKLEQNQNIRRDEEGKIEVTASSGFGSSLVGSSFIRNQNLSMEQRAIDRKEANLTQTQAKAACNTIVDALRSSASDESCGIVATCGDSEFSENPSESETKDVNKGLTDREIANRQFEADTQALQGLQNPERVARLQAEQDRIQSAGLRRSIEIENEKARLECYYDEILRVVTENAEFSVGPIFRRNNVTQESESSPF